jgi:hypothetical protein
VAFLSLGLGPGLVAVLIAYIVRLAIMWALSAAAGVAGIIYGFEAIWVWAFYGRVRSLPLTVTLFWLSIGWVLDFSIYPRWAGLAPDYVLLLLVKQLINGIVNGSIAELLLSKPFVRVIPGTWRNGQEPTPVASFAFRRIVWLALLPATVLVWGLARVQWERVTAEVEGENGQVAREVTARVTALLAVRQNSLADMTRELVRHPGEGPLLVERLRSQFGDAHLVALIDAEGLVVEAYPAVAYDGRSIVGLNVARRDYFRLARERRTTVISELFTSLVKVDEEGSGVAIVVAEPIYDRDQFLGIAAISLDPLALVGAAGVVPELDGGIVTLFDPSRAVIAYAHSRIR